MKPTNTRKPLLLEDGEPVRCRFMARADAPIFREECETDATERLTSGEMIRFAQWLDDHPHAIISLRPGIGSAYLCDAHVNVIRECL